jgi:diguanylate cyclase (GGDEF)-like protein
MSHTPGRARVLVVDDDRFHRDLARDALAPDVRVECCGSAEEALAALAREPADLVLSDLTMPGASGLVLLDHVRRHHPTTDFLLLTGHATVESAVEALRRGATDYLVKPIRPEQLAVVVERALERRRLLAENGRLRDALATVEACRSLSACHEPAQVFSLALDLGLGILGRRRGLALYRRDEISNGLEFRGFSDAEQDALRGALDEKPVPLDLASQAALFEAGPAHEALRAAGVEVAQILAVPLRGEESEAGLLLHLDDGRPFEEVARARLSIVADQAAIALRHAERYRQAKERAFIDDVTELYNARYLGEAMEREIQRAERYGTELSVVFLDLDRFKLVNDQHGHLVGSQALRQLSRLLTECVRQVDTVARYGGDEFTVVLVDTGEETCRRIAERIRALVEATPFDTGRGRTMHLTCSVGLATLGLHGRSREELLEAADKAMYRAKSLGRNRVCSAGELGD